MKKTMVVIMVLLIALVAIVIGSRAAQQRDRDIDGSAVIAGKAKQNIAAQVEGFGAQLKEVSLLSPTAVADIERAYSPYLSRSLLSAWTSYPDRAAGRETSSPWPERIEVIEIEKEPTGVWHVRALLVLMTSDEVVKGGNAGTATLDMTVIEEEGTWKIDRYEVVRTSGPNMPRTEEERPQLE